MSNFFENLEAQLAAAARVRAGGSRLHIWGRLGRLGGVLSITGAVAVTVAVVAVILSVGHRHPGTPTAGHHAPRPPSQSRVASYLNRAQQATVKHDPACALRMPDLGAATTTTTAAPSHKLLSALSVLRRTETAADRPPSRLGYGGLARGAVVYVRYVRRARVVDGVSYYLIPEHVGPSPLEIPLRCYAEQRAALQSLVAALPATRRGAITRLGTQALAQERQARSGQPTGSYDGIEVLHVPPPVNLSHWPHGRNIPVPGSTCCQSASDLINQVSIGIDGQTGYGLVGDGVARVALYYAKTTSQNPRTIIALATRTITVKVSDNMYVVNLGDRGRPAAVAYLSANGTVLRRLDTNQ